MLKGTVYVAKNALNQIGKLSLGLATALLGAAGLKKLARKTVKEISTSSIKTIMTDMYDENLGICLRLDKGWPAKYCGN